MAENTDNILSRQRRRRDASKRVRQSMYVYDTQEFKQSQKQSSQSIEPIIKQQDDDDSFIYHGDKHKKNDPRKKKNKHKSLQKTPQQKQQKKTRKQIPQKQVLIQPPVQTFQYVDNVTYMPKAKPVVQNKIFNPELYQQNIRQKKNLQDQLEALYAQLGKKMQKQEEPTQSGIRWKYLLRQVQEVGKDFASQRQQRYKLKKKICKFAQSTFNRLEQIKQQKVKDQQKKIKKQSLQLFRHVKRQFWGSAFKVRKIMGQQQRKKEERQSKMKKLQDLVIRQFQASQKITKILQGFKQVSLQNIKVSQTTKVPVIIDIQKTPRYKYVGLHQDNVIRPSLLIKFPLREYQLLGVYWISTLHNRGMNAILADEMGLGKTIQTIAFLAHLAIQKGIWGPHLIVVPTTILMNWQIQFKRWCPAFKIMTYFGSPKQRKQKRKGWSKLNSFHVCITSYKIAVTDHPIFKRKKWYYMILDQAQNIKNFKSQRWQILLNFKTRNRLLLTGTPLQNDLTELWSLLHFLMPKIFNSFDDFNEWFNIPFQQALEKNFPISQQILKKLHTVLRPFFLRRLKKDVQTQLPTKSQKIIRCAMSRRQKYLYDQMIWHENKRAKNQQSTGGMMNVLMGLKKICNHPDLFQPRIQQSPLNWVPLTIVIAHHMFLKLHFQTYKTHILKDFVDNFKANFEQIAEDILSQYNKHIITQDNEIYYRHKIADRLFFAKINFERSKRKQFKVYDFDLRKLEVQPKQTPYFMTKSLQQRISQFQPVFDKFAFVVSKVMARPASLTTFPMNSQVMAETNRLDYLRQKVKKMIPRQIECIRSRFLLHFPNKNIVLYDSGKLIKMIFLLKAIKYRGQKALIFTQMTKMLDIFEKVLNMFKFNYVRLDGNTKTQLRQTIVQRFNNDPRVLCFISSTRSGGIGLNLTGASNVIFYDTDWNPAMDKQAQDRCHRIGQTRNVIIYRLITQHSIEQNILIKSIQKRKLQSLVTQQGGFDTSYFEKVSLKGLLSGAIDYNEDHQANLAQVEDKEDRQMLQMAQKQNQSNKIGKQDQQQELQVEMLPQLFKYGLKMLQNNELMQNMQSQEDQQEDYESQQEQERAEVQNQEEQQLDQNDEQQSSPQKARPKSKQQKLKQKKESKNMQNLKQIQSKQSFESPQKGVKVTRSLRNPKKQTPIQQQIEQQQQQQNEQQPIEQQVEQQVVQNYSISTLEKLKAMAIYQSQYLFMKKHFFSLHQMQNANQVTQEQGKIDNAETINGLHKKIGNSEAKTKTSSKRRNKGRKK